MLTLPPRHATHEVRNQPPAWVDVNLYSTDRALQAAVARHGAAWADEGLAALGAHLGTAEVQQWGVDANRYTPVLRTHDRWGRRQDEVEYHPAYHQLMALTVSQGIHCSPWREPRAGAHVARAAAFLLVAQNELGHCCPISMTYACVPTLRHQPELAAVWEPRVHSLSYDPRLAPAEGKAGILLGMAMTEKQGGSDVRANTTRAAPLGSAGPGQPYALTGHKFFCSAPNCDAFLVLAQTDKGLGCFLMPRFLPDGEKNRMQVMRLKDKLGNRSNASSEIELDGALGWLVGDEGRGVRTIIEMANHTRLDCAIGSSAILRAALAQALHHARNRAAFGRILADQPLMGAVLADLALESEAATTLTLRLAAAYDQDGPDGEAYRRVVTPLAKYMICKRTPTVVAEAMEVLGGSGYVEESPLPRMYREAPVNHIWEGSGNIMVLDVLRALQKEPRAIDLLRAELTASFGRNAHYDRFTNRLQSEFVALVNDPTQGRRLVERIALALQAAQLLQHAPAAVAETFAATRLGGEGGLGLGVLPPGAPIAEILAGV